MFSIRMCSVIAAAILLCAGGAEAQPQPAASKTAARELMRKDLVGQPGKEVVMSEIEYPPGGSSAPHRHDAQVFVYVLEGKVIMQVKGGQEMTLSPGQTFYESPSDIHIVSANASKTEKAKFLAILIKDKEKPGSRPVTPEPAR